MPWIKPITLPIGLCLLSGCAWFGEDSQRATLLPMPEIAKTLNAAQIPLSDGNSWPTPTWWTRFQNPTLNNLIETGLADNPDFKAAAARLRQSQAMVDAQAAELYPTVEANISFSAQRYSANSVQAKYAGENFRQLLINPLILRYHLDFWGRDEASLQGAVDRSLAVAAELADAKLLLATAIAGTYFDLLAANQQRDIADSIVKQRETLLKLEQTRLETGLSAQAPLLQAKMALNLARQTQAAAHAEVVLRQNLLAALAGKGADWGREINIESGVCPRQPSLPNDLPLHLLAYRPDISAARLHTEAAAEEIKVAETAFYPDVNLIAFTGLHSVSLSDVILQGSSLAYAVGPSIEFPIFEGGRLRANLSYQEAAYDTNVERYNASLVHAVQEVADALARWREIDVRLTEQRQSVADALESQHIADTLNSTGLADKTASIQAKLESDQQQFRLAAMEAEQCKSVVRLFKALGGGYSDSQTQPLSQ